MRRCVRGRRWAAALVILGMAACGDEGPTAPGSDGTMTATIDGTPWTAATVSAVRSGNIVGVGAADFDQIGLGFAFQDLGTGTYTIGPGEANNGLYNVGANSWNATQFQGSGTIVVTTSTPTRVAGTFEFEAVSVGQTPVTTVSVTNGVFDLAVTDGS